MMRRLIIFTCNQILLGDEAKEVGMGGACSIEEIRKSYNSLVRKLEGN
jgi:hypothetical protein